MTGYGQHLDTLPSRVTNPFRGRARSLLALWLVGFVSLAIATWLCFLAGLVSNTAAFGYLIVIVLLSLFDSFVSSAIFSLIALACLDYVFVEPRFTFQVAYTEDVLTLVGFIITAFVVTALVRRTRALAGAYREQARLLDLTHDTVLVRDVDGVITYWNRGALELYGWTSAEAVGQRIHTLLKTEFPIPLAEITRELHRTGRWEGELVHTKRDGTRIFVSSRWALQRDGNDRPAGTLETNNDITERKRTEEALKKSQATYLAEAQKLSSTGSFGWNAGTGELVWSEESFRIFGYELTIEPSIEAIYRRVHPADAALVKGVLKRAAAEGGEFDYEHRLLMPDGAVKHLRTVARVVGDSPEDRNFVGAVMDISAAKRAQDHLHQTQAELAYVTRVTTLGQLTASIAHEVNQPLAAIVTNGDASLRFLNQSPPQLGEVRDAITRMISEGKRASEIVHRIRGLTKKTGTQTSTLDLNELIRESVSLVQRELAVHQVALHTDLEAGLPAVRGDGVLLQQVIINFVINGVQAMDAVNDRPRDLVVRSREVEPGQVLISVQDSGVGIEQDKASRMFDAFFTTKPNGMGMGLSICRSIIEAHEGGRLWASGNAGHGATFQFSLPAIPRCAS
ncbi:MAG: hypothetical protein JWO51_2114 [Rhodospirillales bacterium]|nr:hypothetical protein [Rhodospirillales bacterium]